MPELAELLKLLVEREGSDLHLRVGGPPILRIHGELTRAGFPSLTPEDTRCLVTSILSGDWLRAFAEDLELDVSYATDKARFRVNVFQRQRLPAAGAAPPGLRRVPLGEGPALWGEGPPTLPLRNRALSSHQPRSGFSPLVGRHFQCRLRRVYSITGE